MIVTSRFAKLSALSVAALAHAAIAVALATSEDALIEGASGAAEVRLGNSFADMVAGTLAAEQAETEIEAERPDTAETETPTEVTDAETAGTEADEITPEVAETAEAAPVADRAPPETARHAEADTARPADPEPTHDRSVALAMMAPPDATQPPLTAPAIRAERALPLRVAPATPLEAQPLQPLEALPTPAPAEPEAAPELLTEETTPAETLEGATPDNTTVSRSLRPKQRSAAFEEKHKKTAPAPTPRRVAKPQPQKKSAQPAKRRVAEPAPKRQQKKAAPAGAKQNTRAGQATGTKNATARSSGSGGRKKSAGNAAASNYPGLVMRKISRAGRPRVNARGAAVVAFSISSGGGLASVSVARSSGSAALDRAAVRVVRNAAPFPRPPSGARRSFTIQIQGR